MSDAASKTQQPPGTETCGCCDGVAASTPQRLLSIAPDLSAIAYRIGDYAQFKESLPGGLVVIGIRRLAGLRTRDADDFTLGLIDAVACAADVLTFYQERLANESYLRTATERVSLQEMAKLIGYRLRPGVAAETWLAFALETPKVPPPGLPPEPGVFVTGIPTSLTLASGPQGAKRAGSRREAADLRDRGEIDRAARVERHAAVACRKCASPASVPPKPGSSGVRNNLKPGDALRVRRQRVPRAARRPTTTGTSG